MCLPSQFATRESVLSISTVSTVFETPEKKLDVNEIRSSRDLDALRESDPFMYYSIPSVRKAALHHKDVDVSVLTVPISDDTQRTSKDRPNESHITRQTRVSFECHSDLLIFEDIMTEFDNVDLVNEHLRLENNDDFFKNYLLSAKLRQ